jgi:hypothetical protein
MVQAIKSALTNPVTWFFVVTCMLVTADMIYGTIRSKQMMGCRCTCHQTETLDDLEKRLTALEKKKKSKSLKKR